MIRSAALLGLVLAFILPDGFAAPPPGTIRPPRNVVLIVADDLGAHDLGCTGSTFHLTPHLDRLASEGMRFTQAYAACTVCSPSRAAMLTGKYPARLRLTDWIRGHDFPGAKLRPPQWTQELPPAEPTLADHLKALGFATAHVGKWHLGGPEASPEKRGFDVNHGGDHRGQPPSYFSPYGLPRLPDGPEGEYLTDREAEEVVAWIREHRDRPFFINYWSHAVHTPIQAPDSDVADFLQRARERPEGQSHAGYAAMLARLDAAVGRILEALETNGIAEDTLVVFTSDNGGLTTGRNPPTSNAPLRAGKGSPYEGGHRVPLIVRWPGVTTPGSTSDIPVMGIDIPPTILDALGTSRGTDRDSTDGESLVPILHDPSAKLARSELFWHYPHYHPGGATPYAAIRAGDWKLIQFYEDGRHELYNLAADPSESRDVAALESARVTSMARRLFNWQNRVGAQWPMSNPAWTPGILEPEPDGTVRLHARHAHVRGNVLRYEPQPFKDMLGWWTDPEDSASWTFRIPSGGRFTLAVLQGCGNGSGGSIVRFKVGDSELDMRVVETGGFQNFTNRVVGEIDLPPGTNTLVVTPLSKPGVAVMDLREVTLAPANPGEPVGARSAD